MEPTSSFLVLMSNSSNLPAAWPGGATEQINVGSTGLQQIVMILQRTSSETCALCNSSGVLFNYIQNHKTRKKCVIFLQNLLQIFLCFINITWVMSDVCAETYLDLHVKRLLFLSDCVDKSHWNSATSNFMKIPFSSSRVVTCRRTDKTWWK